MTHKKLAEAFRDLVARLARHLLEMFLVVLVAGVAGLAILYVGVYLGLSTGVHNVLMSVPVVIAVPYVIWRTVTFNIQSTNQFSADVKNTDK